MTYTEETLAEFTTPSGDKITVNRSYPVNGRTRDLAPRPEPHPSLKLYCNGDIDSSHILGYSYDDQTVKDILAARSIVWQTLGMEVREICGELKGIDNLIMREELSRTSDL